MKNPLSILILLLWFLVGWWYYHCSNTTCNTASKETGAVEQAKENSAAAAATATGAAATDLSTKKRGDLIFDWANEKAITGEGWSKRKSEIMANLNENQLLEITGLYRSDEKNNTSFANLGLARANEVRKLFAELPDERVRLLGKLTESGTEQDAPFGSAEFNYRVNTENIKEIDGKTTIYFPFNSTRKLDSREVESYLNDVADRIKKTGESVILTGHTDDVGSDESNERLGMRRATIVRDYLLQKGVSRSKIKTSSKGESAPISDNRTSKGRALNRRTELQIIK